MLHRQAIQHAQIEIDQIESERFGVMVGTGSGGLELVQHELKRIEEKGYKRLSPYFAPSMLSNIASGEISITFGAKGLRLLLLPHVQPAVAVLVKQ